MRYELLDHTADVFVRAYGKSRAEMFENAAHALFEQIADLSTVNPLGAVWIKLAGTDHARLLVEFLTELLYLHETQELLFSEFHVELSATGLKAEVAGERIDRTRHTLRGPVKAITYHELAFHDSEGYLTVLFDV